MTKRKETKKDLDIKIKENKKVIILYYIKKAIVQAQKVGSQLINEFLSGINIPEKGDPEIK
jgi:hypothetical protein